MSREFIAKNNRWNCIYFINYFLGWPPLNIRDSPLLYDISVHAKFNGSQKKPHIFQSYAPDIVHIFLTTETLACQVVEEHWDTYPILAV